MTEANEVEVRSTRVTRTRPPSSPLPPPFTPTPPIPSPPHLTHNHQPLQDTISNISKSKLISFPRYLSEWKKDTCDVFFFRHTGHTLHTLTPGPAGPSLGDEIRSDKAHLYKRWGLTHLDPCLISPPPVYDPPPLLFMTTP